MSLWQWIIGIGLGAMATVITTNLALLYCEELTYNRRRQRSSKPDFVQNPNENCSICLDRLNVHTIQYLPCCHALHERCLADLRARDLRNECPVCREQFD